MTTVQPSQHNASILASGNASEGPEVALLHAEEDAAFAAALEKHASPLVSSGAATIWRTSALRSEELSTRIKRARVVVVLLSIPFFSLPEWSYAVGQAMSAGCQVLPVLIRTCHWRVEPIRFLTLCPADGKPLDGRQHLDDAYTQIIAHLDGLLKLSSVEVFVDPGSSDFTYVEPSEHQDLVKALDGSTIGLIVQGPSGIGKTSAIKRALWERKRKYEPLLPCDQALESLRRPEDVKGWVVIDDFHSLKEDHKRAIADLIKWAPERHAQGKLILVGTGSIATTLRKLNQGVRQVKEITLRRQPKPRIDALVSKVEQALNVTFEPVGLLSELANGSFWLAHRMAMCAVTAAGVLRAAPHNTSGWAWRRHGRAARRCASPHGSVAA